MTDVELDERVTALEENGGGGNSGNGKTNTSKLSRENVNKKSIAFLYFHTLCIFNIETQQKVNVMFKMLILQMDNILMNLISDTIAFHTVLTPYSNIPFQSAVLFNEVLLNEGDG